MTTLIDFGNYRYCVQGCCILVETDSPDRLVNLSPTQKSHTYNNTVLAKV